MTEDFLLYIWKFKLFEMNDLFIDNDALIIINPGERNTDSGPDFINARIQIGTTIWAGNIEIHINSSDWYKHGHDKSKSYNNIILHVVYNHDFNVLRLNNELMPTLELKDKIKPDVYSCYESFLASNFWIPCQNQIKNVRELILKDWMEHLVIERLEKKILIIKDSLRLNKNDWQQTLYQHLARNFGFKLNAEPFELLAKSLPMNFLAKHKDQLIQIEAMLFGQAGMLESSFSDNYSKMLKEEYQFLKNKFSLKSIDGHLWKFLRLRPYNFPTIRISQFANLIHQSNGLFSKIIEAKNIHELEKLFDVSCSEYWMEHFQFDKLSKKTEKKIGKQTIHLIIINTIVPFLFLYGQEKNEEQYVDKALQLLENTNAENNSIIQKWKETGIDIKSAFETQALIELKNNYCNHKKCLNCRIGNDLLMRYNS